MKILSIGTQFNNRDIKNERFRSSISFLDFDLVIWTPETIFREYDSQNGSPTYNGQKLLELDERSKILGDISRRHSEIQKFLEIGKTIVIILPPPKLCYSFDHVGGSTYYYPIAMSDVLPFKEIVPILAEGNSVSFNGPGIFKPFYDSVGMYLHYSAYLSKSIGKPFLFIKDTTEVIGTFLEYGKGKVILIPGVNMSDFTREEQYFDAQNIFLEGIVKTIIGINGVKEEYILADWANKYLLSGEKAKRAELANKEEELNTLKSKMLDINHSISDIEKNKILICGSGTVLEDQVVKILEEMSFKIIDRPVGRDDIIAAYNDMPAVIEVKGVSKSGAEWHAAQLEKWVSNYYVSKGKQCKGILLVNAFCDTQLEERKGEAFPNQMLHYSSSRGHCLITTVQLLGLYIKVKS